MEIEYDPYDLIEEIKKRPGLWNQKLGDKSISTRVVLWNEVVDALFKTGPELTSEEKQALVGQLQNRWKNIRDAYLKFITNPKTKRPYLYSPQLQFLNCNYPYRIDSDVSSTDHGGKRTKRRKLVKIKVNKSEEEDNNTNDSEDSDYVEVPFTNDDNETSTGVTLTKPEFANVENFNDSEKEDTEKMFLLSLLPHLKSVRARKLLATKRKLLEVLEKANCDDP